MNNFVRMYMFRKILLYVALAAMVPLYSCRKQKILRPAEVAQIMYEIFVADQYAKTYVEVNKAADSVLLFQHIFEEHNCTLEDYQRSIRHYIQDEKAYANILRTATNIAKAASVKANEEVQHQKSGLYFPVPFKYPDMPDTQDRWWTRTFDNRTIEAGKFHKELERMMLEAQKQPIQDEPVFNRHLETEK